MDRDLRSWTGGIRRVGSGPIPVEECKVNYGEKSYTGPFLDTAVFSDATGIATQAQLSIKWLRYEEKWLSDDSRLKDPWLGHWMGTRGN